LKKSEWLQLGL